MVSSLAAEKTASSGEGQAKNKNEIYDLVAVLHQTLEAIADCDIYIKDAESAEDVELIDFFTSLQTSKSQIAEKAQQLLAKRI